MGKLIGSKDWSRTAVGDVASWPQSLKTALSVCLGSKFPMFVWWGPELTVFYNDAYAPILGAAKHPRFLGESARDQWAEVWDTLGPLVEQVHAGNATWFEDFRLFPVIRQGFPEETYFTFSYSPIRDESGRVGGVFCACQETTKRVLADRRLRTLRELAQKTALARAAEEAAKLAASVLEANAADVPFLAIYLAEDGARERLVLEATAAAGAGQQTAPSQILLGEAGSSLAAQAGRALVQRGPVVIEGPLDGVRGKEDPSSPPSARFVLLQITSSDQSQPPVGLLLVGVNPCLPFDDDYQGYLALIATQLATAVAAARGHEAERKRTEALAALDRAKTTFFANVSHELRTPLTLMLGPIEDGLADTVHPLNGVQRERQELARRNGLRLQRLVNTLLDFARIEAGRAHASFVPTDLAALTVDLASSFRSALAAAGLELVVDCPPLPEAVYVDPAMWEKIVLNLLSNAFKFTFKGRIRVALEWRGDHVELTVEDSGTGIPADELALIFERFHRVEGARGRSHEGTGIGLALVQELVRLHEGEAVAQSELGKGSRFTVRLKVRPSLATDAQARAPARTATGTGIGVESFLAEISQWTIEEPGAAQRERAVATPEANSHPGARILVADDNADMRAYLTRLLTARWSVEAVSDGARALEVARAEAPDLVLTDVMMPGVDGLALVRALREDERTRTIPVILLSARAGEESTILGLESGADEYLVKPFSANELLARVNAQLKVAALRKEALRLERARAEEVKVHAEQARTLLDKAEVASRSRDRALAIVSHDLRSPLNAISTAAELIKLSLGSEKSAATAHKRADIIGRSVERMNRLIGDLLDASSLEAGALSFEPELHDAAAVVREIRDALEHQAQEKGVALEIEVLEDLPLVWFDRARILQTLENLVQNAVKFTPSGGTVRVRLVQDDEWLRFVVQDDGPGIAPEALPHIVEPYWHSAVGNRQGHGLGLAIAKGIVDAHGGQLTVESTLGAGSVFSIALPLNPSAPLLLAAPRAVAHEGANPFPAGVTSPAPRQFAERGGEMGELTRAFDWSKTSLGAMSTWPQSLRTSVSTMLRSPYPITLFWGRDQVMLYNDAFRPIHGDKHPGTLGAAAPQALAEAWDVLGPLVRKTLESGEPLFVENGLVVFARRPGGLKEESYFTWSYNPTIGEDGEIAGLFAIASETTRQVVGDRRLSVLRELSIRTAFDRKATGLYRSLEEVLATAGADVPFSLLYIVEGQRARLASCSGVQRGSAAAPEAFELDDGDTWQLAGVVRSGQELLLENLDTKLGALPGGPWQEPATRALALPVPTGADSQSSGVLICGLSPLLHLDEEYRSFLQLLARQVSAGISSARAYEQETQRAEKLAELDRAKTTFFSNVSHEFRTPLTLILGPIEDALAHPARSLEGRKLELVRRSALRLYKMVNALLDFSKVEVGRAQATFVPTDLAAFTTHLVSQFASAAQSAGLELVLDCAPLPEAVYVDPDMWEKVVFNLLSNAVKYTRQGAIRVTLRWEADAAVATVEDTGVGIPQADLEHVFERFYRVQEANGRSYEGTGIGLALARELVELHGGTISVSSRLGDGSTFTVRLPRGSAHLPAERVARTGSPRTSASGAAPFVEEAIRWSDVAEAPSSPDHAEELTTDMPPELLSSHILLVDDNSDLRSYAAGLLGRTFRNVETATNGQDALQRVRANRPDLVISDVMMPIMDGFALVRALRGDERTRSVPIILLSARAGAESAVAGLDSGADDYLVKPFSAIELMARVRGQLEMTRVRAEAWRERGISEELRRSVAARDDFISISSHELRTPLTALSLQLESLLRLTEKGIGETAEKQLLAKLAAALRQTDRLTQLVETLLDVSQLSRGSLELERQRVDLAELVTAAVARFEDDARATGGRFRVHAPSVMGLWDKARLDQLLGSLLSNAVKYAPGTIVDVAVERSPGDDTAKLIVRDSGPGISEEARDRLFQRFERAVPADNYGGFGLGLYLSRRIVEAHGGTIAALSTEGQGTTIAVELPVNGPN